MKKVLIVLVIILFGYCTSGAQTETIVLSSNMFDDDDKISLAALDGWIFKQGNNNAWAQPETDVRNWQKLKPTELSTKLANDEGRIEGWFRIKIELDTSFSNIPVGISRQLWAATDVYIDGVLIESFGYTGTPYQAYNPILKYAQPITLIPGQQHLLSMHIVDYETTLTQRELRLKPKNLQNLISITGSEFNKNITIKIRETYLLGSLSMSVSFVLLLLFLLLLFMNPTEKIFQLTSMLTLVVFLAAIGSFYGLIFKTSYSTEKVIFLITNGFSLPFMHALTLAITEWVLKKRLSWITISILVLMPITSAIGHVFNISWPFGVVEITLLVYFLYLVVTSWKTIKRAEWTVVLAMTALTLGSLGWVFLHKYFLEDFNDIENLIKTLVLLSAPTFLLVYVSIRYKQILMERQVEAKKVIRISEEKKQLLEQQNEMLEVQVNERTHDLEKSLTELKATQSQLIHAEKMASLGELTAGIAHEIQNPLNFVNNFSEVSVDLMEELDEELTVGNAEEVKAIATDLKQNLEKITTHGKRASFIVKGMLEHSRTNTGEKKPTDINILADEFLRLSYHGLRAKDKLFNAQLITSFDEDLPKINLVAQDIGRVLLNLFNNAFHAVAEKSASGVVDFEPKVTVGTNYLIDHIEIKVRDNGNGIPEHVLEKIFQPFFTTKPTGQGTGLGLSISFDIITKGHGGKLKVETREGEFTEFIITLPK